MLLIMEDERESLIRGMIVPDAAIVVGRMLRGVNRGMPGGWNNMAQCR